VVVSVEGAKVGVWMEWWVGRQGGRSGRRVGREGKKGGGGRGVGGGGGVAEWRGGVWPDM